MIIKRKYEQIGILTENDPVSKKIIMDALLSKYDLEEAERIFQCDKPCFLYMADMSLCIPHFDVVMEKLDELDIRKPYDNGLTYRDVTGVQSFPGERHDEIELWMFSSKIERPTRIVQIIAIKYEQGKNKMIEPWEIRYLF